MGISVSYAPSIEVLAADPAFNGATEEFNVVDYGATGDGSTDDTAAIQAAIDAAEAAGGGVVYFPAGVYVVGGALQDTSRSNAQLLLPLVDAVDSEQITIVLRGATPPPAVMSVVGATPLPDGHSVIKGTLNTGAGGALLGGQGPAGSFEDFTFVHCKIENLTFRLPSNPVLTALNLAYVTAVELDNVIVDCGSYYIQGLTEPTTTTSRAIRLPKNNNGAFTRLGAVNVVGFYIGYELGEHTVGVQVGAWGCKQAAVFATASNHASKFERFMAVHCERVLVFTGYHPVSIDQLDIEHAASGWWVTDYDIDDASNYGVGDITWHVVLAGSGPDSTFTMNGGSNLNPSRLGSPITGQLLAQTLYSPASNSTIATRTSATPGDADATNLAVTFFAPASGNVNVVLECLANISLAGQSIWWGLREGSTDLTFRAGGTKMYMGDGSAAIRYHATIPLSGLSAGSHTYKWAISSSQGSASTTNLFAGDAGNGIAIMQVFAA